MLGAYSARADDWKSDTTTTTTTTYWSFQPLARHNGKDAETNYDNKFSWLYATNQEAAY